MIPYRDTRGTALAHVALGFLAAYRKLSPRAARGLFTGEP
jgi:hypothetical protein